MNRELSVVLFGYGQFGCAALAALQRAGLHVFLVVTHKDNPNENCWWQSLAITAQEAGIPVFSDLDLSLGGETSQLIKKFSPDIIFSAFFRDLLGEHLLAIPRLGAWNLHPSLLPSYRGRAAINWQLVRGEKKSGLTVHRMVKRADAGSIIAQQAIDVGDDQDAYGLTRDLLALAPRLLAQAINGIISDQSQERTQQLHDGSVFGRRRPEDGFINWELPARQIHNLVRAVAPPWPGAFTSLQGNKLLITKTHVLEESANLGRPGTILPGNRVICGTGLLSIICAYFYAQQITELPSGTLLTTLTKDSI